MPKLTIGKTITIWGLPQPIDADYRRMLALQGQQCVPKIIGHIPGEAESMLILERLPGQPAEEFTRQLERLQFY